MTEVIWNKIGVVLPTVLAAALQLFPSHEILREDFAPISQPIPHIMPVGGLITLPSLSGKAWFLNRTPFSRIEAFGKDYAVIGTTTPRHSAVYSVEAPSRPQWPLFQHPTQMISVHHLTIDKPGKDDGRDLRLPANVWKRVNEDHDDKKRLQSEKVRLAISEIQEDIVPSCFQKPVDNIVTSKYSSPRNLPNGRFYLHSGVDLRARTGTMIYAAADGVVQLAEHMIVPGRIVILNHGQGLMTRYLHLNEILVEEGQAVKAGQPVGRAGSTGRVQAAHLHWDVIWKKQYGDPLAFQRHWLKYCSLSRI